jgi:hypothetical protein
MKVMTIVFIIAGIIVILLFIGTLLFFYGRGLPLNQVAGFKVEEKIENGQVVLTLSGLDFNSAKCVAGISGKRRGDAIVVIVRDRPADKNCTGSFTHIVTVPPEVNTVSFGDVTDVVWRRTVND